MSNILKQAHLIVHGDRNEAYGDPLENHGLTADYWMIYISATKGALKAEDVCFLNILQKIARSQNGVDKNIDSLVDIAGYAANIEMVLNKRKELDADKKILSGE